MLIDGVTVTVKVAHMRLCHSRMPFVRAYGYTRDFDVEQLYRDSRLKPIHEGTTGIQAIDLLGRKILFENGQSFAALLDLIRHEAKEDGGFEDEARALLGLCDLFEGLMSSHLRGGRTATALASASGFLEGFGHFVVAWIWLGLAPAAQRHPEPTFAEAKRWSCRFFFASEVPRIRSMMALLPAAPDFVAELPERVIVQ